MNEVAIQVTVAAARGHLGERPAPHLRALEQQEQDQDEEREQLDHQGDRAFAHRQGRLAERLGVAGQLGRVPLQPALDVVPGHEVADPAVAVLCAGDVAGHSVRQVGNPVDERDAERRGQADEYQRGPERDDRHGEATARDPPLDFSHDRVEQHRDEPRHDHQQRDVPQPVDRLADQVGSDDHRDRDQDGPQQDVAPVRRPRTGALAGLAAAAHGSPDQQAGSRREPAGSGSCLAGEGDGQVARATVRRRAASS